MKANWIEIKRFLNDYKRFILIGSIIIALLFSVATFFLGKMNVGQIQDEKEDLELSTEESLNDEQPAYFQIYVENEDGTIYSNSGLIRQYFNLDSVKEGVQNSTNIDIKSVEEEVLLKESSDKESKDKIKIINVTTDDSSRILTASFNLGNKRNNLIVAEYYYDLLFGDSFPILKDKKTFVFEEPRIFKKNDLEKNLEEAEKKGVSEQPSITTRIVKNLINLVIGFLLGIVIMIGLALLKVIFGKTIDYSFAYEVGENDGFLLSDRKLNNNDLVGYFVAAAVGNKKVVLSEQKMDSTTKKNISLNGAVTFNREEKGRMLLTESESLSKIDMLSHIAEIIIVIYPKITTRKWYDKQKKIANFNQIPIKILQVNQISK